MKASRIVDLGGTFVFALNGAVLATRMVATAAVGVGVLIPRERQYSGVGSVLDAVGLGVLFGSGSLVRVRAGVDAPAGFSRQ